MNILSVERKSMQSRQKNVNASFFHYNLYGGTLLLSYHGINKYVASMEQNCITIEFVEISSFSMSRWIFGRIKKFVILKKIQNQKLIIVWLWRMLCSAVKWSKQIMMTKTSLNECSNWIFWIENKTIISICKQVSTPTAATAVAIMTTTIPVAAGTSSSNNDNKLRTSW